MATVQLTGISNGTSPTASATTYYSLTGRPVLNATEATRQAPIRRAGTFSKFSIKITVNSFTTTSTARLRINGANGNQSVSITNGVTGIFQDNSNSDTISSGDLLNYSIAAGSGGTLTFTIFSILYEATGNASYFLMNNGSTGFTANSTTRYQSVGDDGLQITETTESDVQTRVRVAGTHKNLYVYINSNARITTTTLRSRKNSGNGNMSISITSGSTGLFEDTTNSDTLASGDLINYSLTTSTGGGSIAFRIIGSEFLSDNDTVFSVVHSGSTSGISYSFGATEQSGVSGGIYASSSPSEANMQLTCDQDCVISYLQAYVSANGLNSATTVKLRINGANGNLSVSIGATSTGYFQDASNSDSIVANDLINLQYVMGGVANTITFFTVLMNIDYATATTSIKDIIGGYGYIVFAR